MLTYFNLNNVLDLWIEEKSDSWCTSGGDSVGAVSTQGGCQGLCEDSETCIGISYSHKPSEVNYCYLCTDDTLINDGNGFGFYRKPGKKSHFVFILR